MMQHLGKMLLFLGIIFIILGLLFILGEKLPGFGRLPGDIVIKKKNFVFYFPLMTSILISVVLTLLFWLISWWSKK